MINIQDALSKIDSLMITDQYESILKIAAQIKTDISQERNENNIQLAKKIKDKIHELRYLMSVMKASNGIIDSRLKKEWQALNDLINNH